MRVLVVSGRCRPLSCTPSGGPVSVGTSSTEPFGRTTCAGGWPAPTRVISHSPGCSCAYATVTMRSSCKPARNALARDSTIAGGWPSSAYARTALRTSPISAAAARS